MTGFAVQEFPELLARPVGGRMSGDIAVQNAPRPDLHCNKHIQDLKRSSNGREEIAGDDRAGVVLEEGRPALTHGSPGTVLF
jgi:hypothetical protein